MPKPWVDLDPGSEEFARVTFIFQVGQGLTADGGLGPNTLSELRHSREPVEARIATPPTDPEYVPDDEDSQGTYVWKNSYFAPVVHPVPGSMDGWDDVMSICDHHIWSARDPDLETDKIRKPSDMVAGVGHTTGYGLGVQRIDDKYESDLYTVDEKYAYRLAEILTYKGDFCIGRTGYLCMMSPLKFRTYHSSSAFQAEYKQPNWPTLKKVKKGKSWVKVDVSEWPKLWPDLKSPLELPGFSGYGGKRNINKHTWSFDLIAPEPGETYTPEQHETVSRLVYFLHGTYGIPIDRMHINGHSDINPLDRSNPGNGLWDPGPEFKWSSVFARIKELRAYDS